MGETIRLHRVFDSPEGEEESEFKAYQMDFGYKVESGAFLAIDIFLKVFDLPREFVLVVEENE
jgi:hypothetical protein